MLIRPTHQPIERLYALWKLYERVPSLQDNDAFLDSTNSFLSDAYNVWIVAEDLSDPLENARGFGLLSFFKEPMAERIVLAIEAFWFADEDLEVQLPIWRQIAAFSRELNFHGVCVAERCVNTPGSLRQLVARGRLDDFAVVVRAPYLQSELVGDYSGLVGGPIPPRVFCAPCVRMLPPQVVDLAGVVNLGDRWFYRGEGRLGSRWWDCQTLHEVARHHVEHGFWARSDARFHGTVREQILQQGYVEQGSCSLSRDRSVAISYATAGGERTQGILFMIDGDELRKVGPIYDAYATMARDLESFFRPNLEVLAALVRCLGAGEAGRFLSRCDAKTRERVQRYGGGELFAGPLRAREYLSRADQRKLEEEGISDGQLRALLQAMEEFWMFALGLVGSVDEIHLEADGSERVEARSVEPMGYHVGFLEVEPQLRRSLEQAADQGSPPEYRQPGWDTTAFGYMAKTCRDAEAFSSGPIPGACIARASIVDAAGNELQTLFFR